MIINYNILFDHTTGKTIKILSEIVTTQTKDIKKTKDILD